MTTYESVFPGSKYSTMLPSYYVAPIYQSRISEIGMSVDPRTANQLGELNAKINPGVKSIEVQGITPAVWESIPEQHLEEIRRLTKLTGVTTSLHGPMIEFSGIGERGYQEEIRVGTEKQLESTLLRAQKMSNEGNISVTVHSTSALPELKPHYIGEDKKKVEEGVWIVNPETGQFQLLRPRKSYFPDEGKFTGKAAPYNSEEELRRINDELWTGSLQEINRGVDIGSQPLRELKQISDYEQLQNMDPKSIHDENERQRYEELQRALTHSQLYLRGSFRQFRELFNQTYNRIDNQGDKKKMDEFAKKIAPVITHGIEKDPKRLEEVRDVIDRGLKVLNTLQDPPKQWQELERFAVDKISQTFANATTTAYLKYGDKAPILNVENPPSGQHGLSSADDLINLIKESREKMDKNLVKAKNMSESEARATAEKMIGATWDVGHINMMRKKGYTEKDVIAETKKIAPFVNHVHLSDNFGLDHTELPMGMGNVPFKPMIDEIKKAGFKGKEIIEAGNWWQFFAQQGGGTPFFPSIEALDSPVYSMAYGPTWQQSGRFGMYYSGRGPINPSIHHNIYGSNFVNLPAELGGEIPGDRGRFAGTPNQ